VRHRQLDAQPPEPGFGAAVREDDVPLAQLAELRKVAEAAARDAPASSSLARSQPSTWRSSIQYSTRVPFSTMRELW